MKKIIFRAASALVFLAIIFGITMVQNQAKAGDTPVSFCSVSGETELVGPDLADEICESISAKIGGTTASASDFEKAGKSIGTQLLIGVQVNVTSVRSALITIVYGSRTQWVSGQTINHPPFSIEVVDARIDRALPAHIALIVSRLMG